MSLETLSNKSKMEIIQDYKTRLLITYTITSYANIILSKYQLIHTQQLAPSENLFSNYNDRWSKGIFTKQELNYFEINNIPIRGGWWNLYCNQFMFEAIKRTDFTKAINKIKWLLDKRDGDILLVCYCKDYRYCHRYIIGQILEHRGYEVSKA